MNFITEQMMVGLEELERVKSGDYDKAYRAAFSGGSVLRPTSSYAAAEWFEGRAMALNLIKSQWLLHTNTIYGGTR